MKRASKALFGEHVRGCEVAPANFRWTTGSTVLTSIFGALFVIGLLAHVVFFPGLLLIAGFIGSVRPWRYVVVTDRGVLVMTRSFVNGKPGSVLGSFPHALLSSPSATRSGSKVIVNFGPERVTIRAKRFTHLTEAIPASPSTFGAVPQGPFTAPPYGWAPAAPAAPAFAGAPFGAVVGPPPGWYPDPSQQHGSRYWNGGQWTEHVHTSWSATQPT
jgi:hypothetical protein